VEPSAVLLVTVDGDSGELTNEEVY